MLGRSVNSRATRLLVAAASVIGIVVVPMTPEAGATSAALTVARLGRVSDNATAFAQAAASPDWVNTPNGLMNKACVSELPAGATIDNGTIVASDGTRTRPAQCHYARLVKPGSASTSRGGGQLQPPTSNGWFMSSWWDAPTWVRRIYSYYTVPSAPRVVGALNYLFSSFEDKPVTSIIQPVLAYGAASSTLGGNYWWISSWFLFANGSYATHGPAVKVSVGDKIWGAMEGNGCSADGSGCHWAIRTVDQTKPGAPESRIDINSAFIYQSVQGGVFESYHATSCSMLPANHKMLFTGIQVWGPTFNKLTPHFFKSVNDQECSMNLTYTSTSTTITWTG